MLSAMTRRTAIGLAVGLVQLACMSPIDHREPAEPAAESEAKLREFDEEDRTGSASDLRYTFELIGADEADEIWSKRVDDVDCGHFDLYGWVRNGRTEQHRFSRRGSPERALYEWHLCFRIGDRTYRGWRGFDPGKGSQIELACRVDAREPPPDTYVCKTTQLEVSPENYGDVAYACREGEICRRFESESDYLAWKALPILTREEKIAATVALIRHELAREGFFGDETYVRMGEEDLPRDVAKSLSKPGHRFHPASEQGGEHGMWMSVANFLRKPDGTMQIDYGYYCGALCAGDSTAILKKNAAGEWEVVSTVVHWVS
jgi:hypothetical protein